MFDFFLFLLLLACFKASISESQAQWNLFISVFTYIDTSAVQYFFHWDGAMFILFFFYIEKYKLRTRKRKLSCWDYFLHFVILLVLKVYFPLVKQKWMINCTHRNQSSRWNVRTVMSNCIYCYYYYYYYYYYFA